MKVLIFGANGMLGHKLYQRLSTKFDTFGTIRRDFSTVERFDIFSKTNIIENIDANDLLAVMRTIESVRPDCVVNAVGIIKQNPTSKNKIKTLTINSIFPNRLAELAAEFGYRLISISTDCVFSGTSGNYSENSTPDARDLYGLSKLLGEVSEGNSLTIRTSIIGRELATNQSIVEWFLGKRGGRVNGYSRAVYTGFPSIIISDILADLIAEHPEVRGLLNVSSDPISKLELLELLNYHYDADVTIETSGDVEIDRSLDSSKFRQITGFEPANWTDMIAQMAADATPYDKFHS